MRWLGAKVHTAGIEEAVVWLFGDDDFVDGFERKHRGFRLAIGDGAEQGDGGAEADGDGVAVE
jgi:hypothetical protein